MAYLSAGSELSLKYPFSSVVTVTFIFPSVMFSKITSTFPIDE
ncbi:MAG: hypothetical protein U9P72_09720 [Campylobacterota bacterium]|nr:hypothetical protein [Campylobacterota bacterium]